MYAYLKWGVNWQKSTGLYTLVLRTDHSVTCAPHAKKNSLASRTATSVLSPTTTTTQCVNGIDTMITAAPQPWTTRMEIQYSRWQAAERRAEQAQMGHFDSFGP